MPRILPLARPVLLLLALAIAAPAAAEPGEVYARGTATGLVLRIPDADLADCELLRPTPTRIVLVVRRLQLASQVLSNRFDLARSIRIVGVDVLGGDDSRVVLDLWSSGVEARMEEVSSGVVLSLIRPGSPPVALSEPVEARRPVQTLGEPPWARERRLAREEKAAAREGDPASLEEIDPADAERLLRAQETDERRERREARERRIAARDAGLAPLPEPSADAPVAPAPEPSPRPAPEEAPEGEDARQPAARASRPPRPEKPGIQPSPATPAPSGMTRVASGSFLMGSAPGAGFADEEPQHPLDLRAFYIDTHEVTVGDFRRSPVRLPEQPAWNVTDDMPVVNVTWLEAEQYCDWAGKRLPTEAEWERAARGTDARIYPWGDGWGADRVNSGVEGDGHEKTAPVGSFPAGVSPEGALDMAGNVWEWTADWYAPDTFESSRYLRGRGPARGAHKVAKGGSFRGLYSVNVRSAIRLPLATSTRLDDVGFRCAGDPR